MTQSKSSLLSLDEDGNERMGSRLQGLSLGESFECISDRSYVFKESDNSQKLLEALRGFKEQEKLCDLYVVVEDGWANSQIKFPCHKVILAARSEYFSNMFLSGMTECSKEEVQIKGIKPEIMQLLIEFSYSGQVTIDVCNVHDLVLAADLLSFITLRLVISLYDLPLGELDISQGRCAAFIHGKFFGSSAAEYVTREPSPDPALPDFVFITHNRF
eukprot:sb/3469999/